MAFGAGLATAWHFQWQTTDLVWSLWLSSLLVGYAMIVWDILGPVLRVAREAHAGGATLGQGLAVTGIAGGAALFLLAFFTVHFGMFHVIHSMFLNGFFPVSGPKASVGLSLYLTVLGRYWYFVPVAALAERRTFASLAPVRKPDGTTTAPEPGAGLAQLGRDGKLMAPYKNVIRMHLLIFFFVFVHLAKLDGFATYAVVYAVYFFPWRLLRAPASATVQAAGD